MRTGFHLSSPGHCITFRPRMCPTPSTSSGSLLGICLPKLLSPAASDSIYASARATFRNHRFLSNCSKDPPSALPCGLPSGFETYNNNCLPFTVFTCILPFKPPINPVRETCVGVLPSWVRKTEAQGCSGRTLHKARLAGADGPSPGGPGYGDQGCETGDRKDRALQDCTLEASSGASVRRARDRLPPGRRGGEKRRREELHNAHGSH